MTLTDGSIAVSKYSNPIEVIDLKPDTYVCAEVFKQTAEGLQAWLVIRQGPEDGFGSTLEYFKQYEKQGKDFQRKKTPKITLELMSQGDSADLGPHGSNGTAPPPSPEQP